MLTFRLSTEVERRLERLAAKAGRTKTFLAREAILRHIEDLEDYYVAQGRLDLGRAGIPLEKLEKEFST